MYTNTLFFHKLSSFHTICSQYCVCDCNLLCLWQWQTCISTT